MVNLVAHVIFFGVLFVVDGIPASKDLPVTDAKVQGQLLQSILQGYDNRILPQINSTIPVGLSIGIRLINLVELFEHEEILEANMYLQYMWTDFRLSWDPSQYQRIHVIHVPVEHLWQPDIHLYNNADVNLEIMNTLAVVFSHGLVFYSPQARVRSRCVMDMTKFPYDQQRCSIKLGSFTYDGFRLNLSMFQTENNNTFDMSAYEANREWHIASTTSNLITTRYPCCAEPYQHLEFNLLLQRKPVYYTHMFVLPAVVIAILVPFQFLLPPDCRERLTLGSALMLGIVLLLGVLQNFLPEAHPNLPYLVQYYCLTMIWIGISIVFSIWVINAQSRGPRKRTVPGFVRQVFLKTLRKIVCLSDDSYYLLDDKESVSLQSIEKHPVNADQAIRNDGNKLERDVAEILRHVNTIVIRTAMAESRSGTRSEWYQVGIVFDRIMCFLFVLIFIVYSCALLS